MKKPRGARGSRGARGARGSTPTTSKIRRTQKEAYGDRSSWEEIKAAVKERDGHRCRKCPSREGLQVDHILPVAKGGRTVMSNLWTLCVNCHCRRPGHQKVAKLIKAGDEYRKSKKKGK